MTATLDNPGPFPCLDKLEHDEPYFLLLARDEAAPGAVIEWCARRLTQIKLGYRPLHEVHQVIEALDSVPAMVAWHAEHRPRAPASYPRLDLLDLLKSELQRIARDLREAAP